MPDEDRLSMLGRNAAQSPRRTSVVLRRRALVACAVLVLALHAALIGGVGSPVPDAATEAQPVPISVRTVSDEPPAEAPVEPTRQSRPEVSAVALPDEKMAPAPRQPKTSLPLSRRPHEPAARAFESASSSSQASTDLSNDGPASAAAAGEVVASTSNPPAMALASIDRAASETAAAEPQPSTSPEAVPSSVGASSTRVGAPAALLGAGEQPPPVYRTQLPPSVTLHYQVRRGLLRGTGEIRWQAAGDHYRLVLEARIAGLTLLTQTSEGVIDVNGLAPVRFLDQRARRSPQAANFRRDESRITYSGTGVEWPLLAGSQDRLSWMIQLAAIAAAEPERLVEGGRITMAVIGARGDAGIWTLRYAGLETIDTAWGKVHAVKLVRDGRSTYDTSAEIWLDPERSYLPAHATLRNGSGASEYDLLLERVEPG